MKREIVSDNKANASVKKAMLILDALAAQSEPVGVLELSRIVAIHHSSVQRLLNSLRESGFVRQANDKRYELGLRFLELAEVVRGRMELPKIAHVVLERLSQATGETVHLFVRDGTKGIYVDRIESAHTVRMVSQVGVREHLHCTGVGKALMAYLSDDDLKTVLEAEGLPRFTDKTITDFAALQAELKQVRERQYAIDLEESESGICCVGTAIFDHQGQAIASISVAGPSFRMTPEKLAADAALAVSAGKEITRSIGGRSAPFRSTD